jgi:carbamoyl-phosphate synthase large subunit
VCAADLAPERSAACHHADRALALPRCDDPGYAEAVLDAAGRVGADVVVPTIDPELLPLAGAAGRFEAGDVWLVLSQRSAVEIARDKLRTARALEAFVPTPRTWSPRDAHHAYDLPFPVLVKPTAGSSSIGIWTAHGVGQLPPADDEEHVVQELLSGTEHTVNAYVDRDGRLVTAVAHRRIRVRDGEVAQGAVVESAHLAAAAEAVLAAIPGLRGPWCFQAFVAGDGDPRVFEINARFGGGYPLADAAGAPFAEWVLRERLGLALPDPPPPIRAGLTMLRYDQSVFVDP